MRKFIPEILEEINKNPAAIQDYKNNAALILLFQYAFLPEKKFDLPEGAPPYKRDSAPIGMSPIVFMTEFRRFYIFTKEKQLPKIRKEALFVQLLESIHPSEAEILLCIKDQNLNRLYSNITRDIIESAGFIPKRESKNESEKVGGILQAKKS
jgi:hypothetical protein